MEPKGELNLLWEFLEITSYYINISVQLKNEWFES